jgi:hypothetical protein
MKSKSKSLILNLKILIENFFSKSKPALIMTILARDEGDIVEENIKFHLNHGVDFIIATDNDSVDNTRNIFKKYERKGVLHLIDEAGRNKSQAKWNNRMTKIAIDDYGADVVFHCDADEFWCPKSGNLKNEILNESVDVMSVDLVNVLLEDKNGEEIFPADAKYAMVNPIETSNFKEDSKFRNLYFFRYPAKVIFKTEKGLLKVVQGNHSIVDNKIKITTKKSSDIKIFHFPLRGKKRFYNKVVETGKAVEKNSLLKKSMSWHIRRWFDAYKDGALDDEYRKLIITKREAIKMKKAGMIKDFDFKKFIEK